MWGLIQKEKPIQKRSCPQSQHRTLRLLPIYLGHSTLNVDLSDSWASGRNLLFSLQAFSTPDVRLLKWPCESIFCFSPIFCFLFPSGSRAIRYYISTRTTVAVPTSNSRESEESIPTHHLLYVACTPRVACTVRLVLMCTWLLRAGIFTSNFCFLFVSFSLMRSPLMVSVSYIEFFFATDFASGILYHI